MMVTLVRRLYVKTDTTIQVHPSLRRDTQVRLSVYGSFPGTETRTFGRLGVRAGSGRPSESVYSIADRKESDQSYKVRSKCLSHIWISKVKVNTYIIVTFMVLFSLWVRGKGLKYNLIYCCPRFCV